MNKSVIKTRRTLKLLGFTIYDWSSNKIVINEDKNKIYHDAIVTEMDYKILEKYKQKTKKNDNDYWWK